MLLVLFRIPSSRLVCLLFRLSSIPWNERDVMDRMEWNGLGGMAWSPICNIHVIVIHFYPNEPEPTRTLLPAHRNPHVSHAPTQPARHIHVITIPILYERFSVCTFDARSQQTWLFVRVLDLSMLTFQPCFPHNVNGLFVIRIQPFRSFVPHAR